MSTLSAFGGGLFIVPLLTLIGAIVFGYKAFRAHESGSLELRDTDEIDPETGKLVSFNGKPVQKWFGSDAKIPYTDLPQTYFSVVFLLATIAIVIAIILES